MRDRPLEVHLSRRRRRRALAAIAVGALALLLVADAGGETAQHENLLISAHGGVVPHTLPRHGFAPVHIKVAGQISTTDGRPPPRLLSFSLEVNRHGRLFNRGLPVCHRSQLRDATTQRALKECRGALVGRGHVAAHINLPDQAPFPAEGTLLAFNARVHGHPAVLGHVYGIEPVATTAIVTFVIGHGHRGPFGPRITTILPSVASNWGFIAAFSMNLGRSYRVGGRRRSYLSAGCPAPRGFPGAPYELARLSYQFEGEPPLATTIQRACRVRGR